MDFQVYQHRLSQVSARLNLMVALVFGLLLSNLFLSGLSWYLSVHQRVMVTPFSGNTPYTQSDSNVDARYLSLMSENFINERLNVTPETVKANHERLLRYVDGSRYAEMQTMLQKEAVEIEQSKLSSDFMITEILMNPRTLKATVTGVLERHVGLRALKEARLTYELSYRYRFGRLTLLGFIKTQETEHV